MGIYLNPNNENFKATLTRKIYVDKTMMISVINEFMSEDNKYICISRPRRFGKTIAGNMLSAYFSKGAESRALFAPYKIASDPSFERNLNRLNVIKIDMNSEYRIERDKENLLNNLTDKVLAEMKAQFPTVKINEKGAIAQALIDVYAALGEQFVIIIDEYDVLVRENVPQSLFTQYLDFLNGLFKSDTVRPAIALAYLTGILPVVRDRIQSKLNNFEEYTILDAGELAEFIGFTSDEVKDLCLQYDVAYEEMKRWYDGYSQHGLEIYNPESVVKSIQRKAFENFWSKTSTYAVISDRIQQNFGGTKDDVIKMLAGEEVDVNVLMYMNTMTDFCSKDDVFTYLIHLGYLAYDRSVKQCYIPNSEVRSQWILSIRTSPDYTKVMDLVNDSKNLLRRTIEGDADYVAQALDKAHTRATNPLTYNNESSFQSAIGLAYFYANAQYTVIKELPTGKGYADVALIPFVPNIPAIIIELKNNKTAQGAVEQIRARNYDDALCHYRGDLLFVGVNYDTESKTHECKIERYEK